MTRIIGYLRHDTQSKDLQSELDQLKAAGANLIVQERTAGTQLKAPELDKLMADVRAGDTVVVVSLDRIAHNTRHLLEIVETLNAAGATFKILDHGIDTSTPHGQVLPVLLCAITDFERQIVRARQAEGIERAKQDGRYKGRKPTARAKTAEVLTLSAQGLTRQKIADQLGIGVASVYRILKNQAATQKKRKKPVVKQKRVESQPAPVPQSEQLTLF